MQKLSIRSAAFALAAVPWCAHAQDAAANLQRPGQELLRVNRYADDTEAGSLRFAIEASNRAPGRYRIEIEAVGKAPYIIKPTAPLPQIKGPARIEGAAWRSSGAFIVIDGSGFIADKGPETCPGAVPGQFGANVRTTTNPGLALVDAADIDISGLEIRNFCIGILVHRASRNVIHDNRIVANRGGAGIMLTGDDGAGNPTATTTLHNKVLRNEFLDNGDGLELTRGAAFNLVADNIFRSTAANPEPSQGIEILLGHDNVVVNNRFEGYSDGIQINGGNRNYIGHNVFTDNTLGLSLSGRDNIIASNTITGNAVGVAVRPSTEGTVARLSRNQIYDNGRTVLRCYVGGSCDPNLRKGGIVLGTPGPGHARYVGRMGIGVVPAPSSLTKICPDGAPVCDPAPNAGIAAPTLDTVRRRGTQVVVQGHVDATPNGRFTVEIFANRQADGTEGEIFLSDLSIATDAKGFATFTAAIPVTLHSAIPPSFTATLTSSAGATSEFSKPAALVE